jgi:4-hydroxybenzoate polyprenyltransferase
MISFLHLIRYKNLIMVFLSMFLTKYFLIESFISTPLLSNIDFIILTTSILLITIGGYLINDIYDIESDKINKPDKVYITTIISIKNGLFLYFLTSIAGLILGFYLSINKNLNHLSGFFIVTVILLFIYTKILKKLPLIGNIIVALLVSLPIFLVYEFDHSMISIKDIFDNLFLSIIIFFYLLFAFLTTLIREIIKDLQDIKGDNTFKLKTLPIMIGNKKTINFVVFLSFLLQLILLLVLIDSFKNDYYLLLIFSITLSLLVAYLIYKLRVPFKNNPYQLLSSLMKIIMLVGVLSMTIFKFN